MTFTNGSKLFYSINNVSFDDLCTILRHRHSESTARNKTTSDTPYVYFDINWLSRKLSSPSDDGSNAIISLSNLFTSHGISVALTHDNRNHRHHSKKATLVRDQLAEQSRIDVIFLKKKLSTLVHLQRSNDETNQSIDELKQQQKTIERIISTKEKIVEARIKFSNLFEEISYKFLSIPEKYNPHLLSTIEAKTQADHVITYESIHGNCNAAIANDGDFIMMGGKDMLLIKDFTLLRRSKDECKASKFNLASSHLQPLKESWCDILKKPLTDIHTPDEGFNLLENDDPQLRAVMAIGTGCDVIPKGIKGVGIKTLKKYIDDVGPNAEKNLQCYAKDKDYKLEVLQAYLSCLIHEPGDVVKKNNDGISSTRNYLHFQPQCLPVYCEEFGTPDTTIDHSVKLTTCEGYVKGTNLFMEKEGTSVCAMCKKLLCRICTANINAKVMGIRIENDLCLSCYGNKINGVEEDTPSLTYNEMKRILYHEHNIHDVNDLTLSEVTELYDVIATTNLLDHEWKKYPKYASNLQQQKMDTDVDFSMKDGGYENHKKQIKN